ncbi:PREDICTED: glutaredoxin isoform X2 [Theobroma cacao]|uniref:Glutaredoxin isoform X2 n=2 Tax=Theobroma cacao TaxID=3641 RepID=A0AB32W0Y4_THECC|nr:PREDICTED: glutaredoxin isoform X2 [Theobroma cacao]EOY20761.1 Glutaredoxin [Theobroma cacao]
MGSWFSSSKKSKEEIQMALDKVKQIVSSNQVVVFSKTYCGFCNRVKQLFTQLGASYKTIELNQESDGDDMQAALLEWTGQRTVPNVFIGGIHIGGCDSVVAKHQAGQLVNLLTNAGAVTVSA